MGHVRHLTAVPSRFHSLSGFAKSLAATDFRIGQPEFFPLPYTFLLPTTSAIYRSGGLTQRDLKKFEMGRLEPRE